MDIEAREKAIICWKSLLKQLENAVLAFNEHNPDPKSQWKHNSDENCFWVARGGRMLHCRLEREQDRYVVEVEKNQDDFIAAEVLDQWLIASGSPCPDFGASVMTTTSIPFYIDVNNDGEEIRAVLRSESDSKAKPTAASASLDILKLFLRA